jgi:hypothetical protein
MKLLLIPLLISLVGCTSGMTVNNKYQHSGSVVDLGVNITRDLYYTVPKGSMREHQRCVDFTLRELRAGEECKWQTGQAVGIVKLAKIDSNGCHTMLNTIYYRNQPKYFQETYCQRSSGAWFLARS